MEAQKTLFEGQLTKIIEDEIERLKDEMSDGAYTSMDQYHKTCGRISGLRDIISQAMPDAREKSQQRAR